MTDALPHATPSSQGVAAHGIDAFLDAIEEDPAIEPHSVMLLRHGHVIAEGWWAPFTADRPHLLYSLSKTFVAAALGFAIDEGLMGLDERVVDAFPEFAAEITTPRARALTVRHLAAMASGHTEDMLKPALATDSHEPVRGFLLHEPEEAPGTVFAYNQPCTYTLAAILQRRAGTDLIGYLRPRLLDPLGIPAVGWQAHPPGRSIGFSGLYAPAEAIAKLGQLHLNGGRWEGRQLLPAGWVDQVATHWVDTPRDGSPDWSCGYGFQVWHSRHGYRGDGAFGQFCLVLPEQDAVLATTASTESMQALLDAAWTHLLPAMDDGRGDADSGSAEADTRLQERLDRLTLPVADAASFPSGDVGEWIGRYTVAPPPDGPVVEWIEVDRPGETWSIVVRDAHGGTVASELSPNGWSVEERDGVPPIAVSGGWQGGRLRLSLLFLETPHRLELELDAATRQARARWAPPPLRVADESSLSALQAPRPLR